MQPMRKRLAFDELDNQGAHPGRFLDAVNCGNAGMVQRRQCPGFALESLEPLGVAAELRRQHLERDIAAQSRIPRAIHLAHAALAELLDDKKWAEIEVFFQWRCLAEL